jgi:uncharacterized protein (TIGR03067 family)
MCVMPPMTPACRTGRHLLLVALASIMPFLAAARGQERDAAPLPDDRARSAGRWRVAAVEWDGKPVDDTLLSLLQVDYRADGSWSVFFKSIPVAEGTSVNHADESPKTFEMATHGSDGVEPRRYAGIYRIDGDTRVLCIVPDGQRRPTDFSAPRRTGRMLVTLRRAGQATAR